MRHLFLKKTVSTIIIISLIFGVLGNIFIVKKTEALTVGEAVGKATAAGVVCFGELLIETKGKGFIDKITGKITGKIVEKIGEKIGEEATGLLSGVGKVPVFDKAAISAIKSTSKNEVSDNQTTESLLKAKDCVRDVMVKMLLDWIVDETVKWVNGEGEPAFVSDWKTFGKDAFNAGVGEVAWETNAAFLCSPFKLQVQLSLLPVPRFSEQLKCTLTDIVDNIETFYNDFSKGGWVAYNALWEPQNNYYGAMLMINDEMLTRAAASKEAAQNEAIAGGGFKSQRICSAEYLTLEEFTSWENRPEKLNGKKLISDQGDILGLLIKDVNGHYCQSEYSKIITPGSVIGTALAKAVTSNMDWANNIKSWTAALTNAIINRLIKKGVNLMKGSSESGSDYDTSSYEDAIAESQRQQKEAIIADYQEVLDDRNAVLADKEQAFSTVQQIVAVLNKLKVSCASSSSDIDIEINSAQSEVNRITTEITDLKNIITEVEALKAEGEMDILIQKYNEFGDKYGYGNSTILTEVYSGSGKEASQEEVQNKQIELSNVKTRLANCIQTATLTQP